MASIPSIHIDQQSALIGVKTTNAQVSVESTRPRFRIKNELPRMTVDRKNPEFQVNWEQVRKESGLEGPISRSQSNAVDAQQHALQYTAEAVQYGNALDDIEQPTAKDRIATLERNKTLTEHQVEVNFGNMPQNLPEVQWDPGHINISWSNASMQIDWDSEFMPQFAVEPHSVEIFLRNKPYIRISFNEAGFPKATGRTVDQEI